MSRGSPQFGKEGNGFFGDIDLDGKGKGPGLGAEAELRRED